MARFVPIIIKVSGDREGEKAVQEITNAFKKMESQASSSAKGSSNAFSHYFSADFFAGLARQAFNAFLQEGKQFISDSVRLAQELQNALLGVGSVAAFKGIDKQAATDAVNNLFIVKSGLISVADASVALKNLLQSGFGLEKSITLISRFGDSAAFGKQAALSYGEAIRSATEGIKNQNSILVDNAGVTKNIEVLLKERGFTMQDLSDKVKGLSAREALYKGLLAETEAQLGDSAKLTNTYTGAVAAQDKAYQDLQRSIGQIIITNPSLIESNKIVTEQLNETTGAIINQGTEAQKTARQMINAYALIKANFVPLVAFLKNVVVVFGESLGVVVTAVVGSILWALEATLNAVERSLTELVNKGAIAINSIGGPVGLPQIPLRQPSPDVDLGSKFFFNRMNEAIKDLGQATRNLAEIERERAANARRVSEAGFVGTGFGSSSLADRTPRPIDLRRAQALAEEQRAAGAKGAKREHLSELEKIDQSSERATMKTLYQLGQRSGFVAGTNQSAAAHNKGSLHPLGRALDFSVRGKSPAQVAQFISELREEGFTVFDERTRPAGQKKWSGPHIHAQFSAGGIEGPLGTAAFAARAFLSQMRGGPIQAGPQALSGLQPIQRLTEDEKYLEIRKESLDYENQLTQAVLRRRNIEAEANETFIQGTVDLINVETDLIKFRLESADDQLTQQRRLLNRKDEELDLLLRTRQIQDEIANGPYNESLRIQLALLQDIADFRRRDEEAIKDKNRAELELADATIYHAAQADAAVLKFLASQRSVTEVIADAKIGVIQTTFDLIDRGLDKFTSKLGMIGSLVKELLSGFIRLALSKFFQSLYGGAPGQATGAGGRGGGIGGFLGGLFGGLRSSGGGAAALTGGFAGGPGGGAFFGSGGIGLAAAGGSPLSGVLGLLTGGGITAPTALSASQGSGSLAQLASLAGGNAASAAGAGGAFSLAGLGAAFAPMLPFLGAGLGSQLGGSSRFGSILGGVGGLALGGAGAIALLGGPLGILASTGSGLAYSAAALLTNPFTIAAGVALIVAALVLAKNAQRKKEEKIRNTISNDTGTAIWELIDQARSLGTSGATARWNEIKSNYWTQIAQIKDSKTRRNAELQWNNDFAPLWEIVKQRAKEGDQAKEVGRHLVPEFAMGGMVPFRGGMQTLIKVRPGELMIPPGGGFGVTVPGVDRGVDSVFATAPPRTRVLTRAQQAGARGYANGGVVGSDGGDIVIQANDERMASILGLLLDGLDTSQGQKVIVRSFRRGRQDKEV